MSDLHDPTLLGAGIATAFVATIYGVELANLLLLPIANRLKSIIADVANWRELVVEGFVSIAQGENPRHIEARLASFAE
jgi:chemotaxis protein MotA